MGASPHPLWILVLLAACSSGPHAIEEHRTTLSLGESTVDLVRFEAEAPGRTYLNLHDDEQTSVEVALQILRREGGTVFELQHGGVRNISFLLDATEYRFDPNRMFSDGGAMVSLANLGGATPEPFLAVRAFADEILLAWKLADLETVIMLHNSSTDRSSVTSYAPGGELEDQAAATFVAEHFDPHDFFFVTTTELLEGLRSAGYNVVLQDNARATDDGSLSIYCAKRDRPYANVEALHGHLEVQVEMLLGLEALLAEP